MHILHRLLCLCIIFRGVDTTAFYYTGTGGFANRCPIACNEGYFLSGGSCLPKVYVVQFQVAVTLPLASTFNVRKYIASMASLAGVSGCEYAPRVITANRLYETVCTTPNAVIRATVDTANTVSTSSFSAERRLLAAAGTADVTTEIRIESDPVKANTVQQSVSVSNINTQLTANSVGTTTTVSIATITVQSIVPTTVPATPTTRAPTTPVTTPRPPSPPTTAPAPPPSPPAPPPSPPASPSPPAEASNTGIIIGVVAGVAVVAAIGITAAVVCIPAKKKQATPVPLPVRNGQPQQQQLRTGRVQSRFSIPIPPNATQLYSAVPQQLYPVYPLQHIQIHEMW
jgi:hypothetical protein